MLAYSKRSAFRFMSHSRQVLPPVLYQPFSSESRNTEAEKWYQMFPKLKRFILKTNLTDSDDLATIIAKSATVVIKGTIIVSLLGGAGLIDTKPIIAGASVTGVAIGFATKEIVHNYLSGFLIASTKPFMRGQNIRVLVPSQNVPLEGMVESIDSRYVNLRTKDGTLIMIPSGTVYGNPIMVTDSSQASSMK